MKDKISIIIPVYNCEKYITKCINSILNQTYKNFELILVNDGSKDNSLNLCKKIIDDRIFIYSKENGGASSARNYGLDKATGKYIMFVDSDDWIDENMIEILYNNLLKNKADISICSCKILRDKNQELKKEEENKIYIYNNIDMCKRMKSLENGDVGDVVWGKLYKSSLFKNLRFVEGMMNEDSVLLYELYYNCKKGVLTNNRLYNYCVFDNNSVSRKRYSYKHLDNFKAYKLRIEYFKNKNEELYDLSIKEYMTNITFNYYLIKKHLKDKELIKNLKKEMKDLYNEVKKSNYLTKKDKTKLYFQKNLTAFYSFLQQINLKRLES